MMKFVFSYHDTPFFPVDLKAGCRFSQVSSHKGCFTCVFYDCPICIGIFENFNHQVAFKLSRILFRVFERFPSDFEHSNAYHSYSKWVEINKNKLLL